MVENEEEKAGNDAAEIGGVMRLSEAAHKEGGRWNAQWRICRTGDERGSGCIDQRRELCSGDGIMRILAARIEIPVSSMRGWRGIYRLEDC